MAVFVYIAKDSRGTEVKGEMDAISINMVNAELNKMGLKPISVDVKPDKGGFGDIKLFEKKSVDKAEFVAFLRQMATLINAGLPLLRCLSILYTQQKPGPLKKIIQEVTSDIESGVALSDAFARHQQVFEKLFVNMIKAGEMAGILGEVIQRLSDFYEKSEKLRAKVKTAMIYPAFVVLVSVAVVSALVLLIVPKFAVMFADMNLELPAITSFLIVLSDILKTKWPFFIAAPVLFFIVVKFMSSSESMRKKLDSVKLHLPAVGDLVIKVATTRFARTLGTLLNAGVPLLDALMIVKDTVGNDAVGEIILRVHNNVREGEAMAVPLKESKIFNPMVINMVEVGEETGKISEMLIKIADIYDTEVDNAVTAMTSLMEPVLIVGLALVVGFIVIAMFLPMISIISGVG